MAEKLLSLSLDHVGAWHEGACGQSSLQVSLRTDVGLAQPELSVQLLGAQTVNMTLLLAPDQLEALAGFFGAAAGIADLL
jgi:hypothetical protein